MLWEALDLLGTVMDISIVIINLDVYKADIKECPSLW